MFANHHSARTSTSTLISVIAGSLALTACLPPAPEPTPVPSPTPTPVAVVPTPTPTPPPAPVYANWLDAPQTPGDWSYRAEQTETLAIFGTGRTPDTVQLIIRCDRATRRVSIARAGSVAGQVDMQIRTETQDRVLTATPVDAAAPLIVVQLPARDSLLDAIAFSRGRFAVETPATAPVYAPAYPEITRVVEDCRS